MSPSQNDRVPASGAALVPACSVLYHAVCLWLGAARPSVLEPLLPLWLEVLLVWLPLASLCLWYPRSPLPNAAKAGPSASKAHGRRTADALVSAAALFCLAAYVWKVRIPIQRLGWEKERIFSELHALASTSAHGTPYAALACLLGFGAVAAIVARAVNSICEGSPLLSERSALLGAAAGLMLFAVGSSAVLRYASGSPWPFFG